MKRCAPRIGCCLTVETVATWMSDVLSEQFAPWRSDIFHDIVKKEVDGMGQAYPVVLLYQAPELIVNRLKQPLKEQGIAVRIVSKQMYTIPLDVLLGLRQPGKLLPRCGIPLAEPMLVMHGFSSEQVDTTLQILREHNVRIDLKAVTTPTNLSWTSLQIYAELRKEREAFYKKNKG